MAINSITPSGKLKRLGRFGALIIDDIGYVQQSREETEVLFTLLADRYERGSGRFPALPYPPHGHQ